MNPNSISDRRFDDFSKSTKKNNAESHKVTKVTFIIKSAPSFTAQRTFFYPLYFVLRSVGAQASRARSPLSLSHLKVSDATGGSQYSTNCRQYSVNDNAPILFRLFRHNFLLFSS